MARHARVVALTIFVLALPPLAAQEEAPAGKTSSTEPAQQQKKPAYDVTSVNPILGSVLPKDVPWRPLTGHERWRIYVNRTYLSVGAISRHWHPAPSTSGITNPKIGGRVSTPT